MKAKDQRIQKESILFGICMAISIVFWLVLVVTIVGLFYGAIIGFFLFVTHALMLAHIRGNGVRLSETQLPEVYAKVVSAAQKFEMTTVPDAYVMQAGGALNAFATKFVGRKFIIIYADLLEACADGGKEADMIIGHEMGHLALGHLKWLLFLAPARMIPWLGTAYSRACEYSCDRCGFQIAGDLDEACRGLAILAAGGKMARQMNMDAYMDQAKTLSGFWSSVFELNASHPYLPKRAAALINWTKPGTIKIPGRNILAYPMAPFLGFGGAGAVAAPFMIIAIIGIMAAIAIPQFQQYRAMSDAAMSNQEDLSINTGEIDKLLRQFQSRAEQYFEKNGAWPCTTEQLGADKLLDTVEINEWGLEVDCEQKYIVLFYMDKGSDFLRAIGFETGIIETDAE